MKGLEKDIIYISKKEETPKKEEFVSKVGEEYYASKWENKAKKIEAGFEKFIDGTYGWEKEQHEAFSKIVELLKNNKIDEIVVAGDKVKLPKKTPEAKDEFVQGLKPDFDTLVSLYLLNECNLKNPDKKTPEEIYNDYAKTSIVKKGGEEIGEGKLEKLMGKYELPENNESKLIVYIDNGGKWLSVEKDGKTTTVYIDHHGSGKRPPTSAAKTMMNLMKEAGILKNVGPWLRGLVDTADNIDNLTYVKEEDKKGNRIFDENYFRTRWFKSLPALVEKQIPFEILISLCEEEIIKNPSVEPFTDEELKGQLGNTLIKTNEGEFSIRELCEKRKKDVSNGKNGALESIGNIINNNRERKLNLGTKDFGKIVYQDYSKNKFTKGMNFIAGDLAIKATVAKGYDTFINLSTKKSKDGYKTFYITSIKSDKIVELAKRLNEADPNCATEIRGTFIFGKTKTLTEEQFLNIIDPKILNTEKVEKTNPTEEGLTEKEKNEKGIDYFSKVIDDEKKEITKAEIELGEKNYVEDWVEKKKTKIANSDKLFKYNPDYLLLNSPMMKNIISLVNQFGSLEKAEKILIEEKEKQTGEYQKSEEPYKKLKEKFEKHQEQEKSLRGLANTKGWKFNSKTIKQTEGKTVAKPKVIWTKIDTDEMGNLEPIINRFKQIDEEIKEIKRLKGIIKRKEGKEPPKPDQKLFLESKKRQAILSLADAEKNLEKLLEKRKIFEEKTEKQNIEDYGEEEIEKTIDGLMKRIEKNNKRIKDIEAERERRIKLKDKGNT